MGFSFRRDSTSFIVRSAVAALLPRIEWFARSASLSGQFSSYESSVPQVFVKNFTPCPWLFFEGAAGVNPMKWQDPSGNLDFFAIDCVEGFVYRGSCVVPQKLRVKTLLPFRAISGRRGQFDRFSKTQKFSQKLLQAFPAPRQFSERFLSVKHFRGTKNPHQQF